jgi:putative beta-lysine N-acetyltransferase
VKADGNLTGAGALSVLQERFGTECGRSRTALGCTWPLARGGERELVYDPHNDRLKLYDIGGGDLRDPAVRFWRDGVDAVPRAYSKLVVYGRPGEEMTWVREGYVREAIIWGFFADGTDAWLWSAFAEGGRDLAPRDEVHDRTVALAAAKPTVEPEPPEGLRCRRALAVDAPAVSSLLGEVFPDYPTPTDPETVASQITEERNVYRMLVDSAGGLVAAASAEIDHERRTAELTDCATRPGHRGGGLMAYLLRQLEHDMVDDFGIDALYTIARADEVGMNCVFSKLGWVYTGRLVNNCRMPNGWESMNIWCRSGGARPEGGPAHP